LLKTSATSTRTMSPVRRIHCTVSLLLTLRKIDLEEQILTL